MVFLLSRGRVSSRTYAPPVSEEKTPLNTFARSVMPNDEARSRGARLAARVLHTRCDIPAAMAEAIDDP